ncbi:class I adenylate-forming enzyme family protein [Frankia alni]|uniref:Crotonobetaine/carnitine-CoA ligase n=1 Tax=Frankia alni (strain DSM 45986 / CECT 9034 / ACN14a) TaxID=326424 RepID=Q0RF40_FRAAA|nr:AMP-binding protein [Frankia alni]CAJ63911.1 putative crotonobetaine/carnitine-CoA ligase [Frankia alni ACN14a]
MTANGATSASAATFSAAWRRAVADRGASPFLSWESSTGAVTTWTYAEFDRLTGRVAARLRAAGLPAGGAVHLALANSPAFVAVWLAAVVLGAHIVPADPAATAPEIAAQLTRTRAVVGICSPRRRTVYAEAAAAAAAAAAGSAGAGSDLVVFAVDEDDVELATLTGAAAGTGQAPSAGSPDTPGLVTPGLVTSGPETPGLETPGPETTAAVLFTSGTTSAPKGVVITQANYAFAGATMAAAAGLGPADRQLVALPLFHANAQYYSFAAAISVGASVALLGSFSASRFLAQAARHRATHASLFAAPMRMILARGAQRRDALVLRHVWFAQNVTADQYERLAALLGCRPRQLYGMTETTAAVLTSRPDEARPDAMGRPTPGCAVRLSPRPDGGERAPGEVGELLVGGERGARLFAGYLDDPGTTRRAFVDGWFRTGDRAYRDADGVYHFAGRDSETLKVAGENVSVVEVEAVVAEHPGVLEAAVVGRPDPVRDEVPVAYVVADPRGAAPGAEELAAWCRRRLSPVKRPREFVLVDELPRTSVGKIRKFLLPPAPAPDS